MPRGQRGSPLVNDIGPTPPPGASDPYLFGDLLALARASWARQMAVALAELGYADYRRTDAALLRMLRRVGPLAISAIGTRLGVTRQAARKLADGLQQRGYATDARSLRDGRVVVVTLTEAGAAYADALLDVVVRLNRAFASRVSESDLVVTDTVLRAALTNDDRSRAARLVAPPRGRPDQPVEARSPS
jgi:DNA-binding MarR family transcriptional regulator